jgi:hypothetical protein
VQLSILVVVKEFDYEVAFGLRYLHESIVSEEVYNVHWLHKSVLVSIKPIKSTIWVELLVGADEDPKDVKFFLMQNGLPKKFTENLF